MGSAAEARARLTRLAISEWKERVDTLLRVAGYTISDFPHTPWESYYTSGLRAGRVAEVIIACNAEIRSKSKQGSIEG